MQTVSCLLYIVTLLATLLSNRATSQSIAFQAPIRLILDNDMGPDYDDVGAVAVMHALADSGKVTILATMAYNQSKYIAPVLDVLNTYYKRPDIPIGVVRGRAVNMSAWQRWRA